MASKSTRATAPKVSFARRVLNRLRIPRQQKQASPEPSELTQVNLRNERAYWYTVTFARVVTISALIAAIVVGTRRQVYTIKTKAVFGNTVDPDLQLAVTGLINKIMDMLVTKTLENFAGTIVTIAMTAPYLFRRFFKCIGAGLADFELADELKNPWSSISALHERRKNFGWRKARWSRFALTFVVSVCVLLQGLAINTVAYPKERWYPDDNVPWAVTNPLQRFQGQGMDWSSFWDSAWSLVGNGNPSWLIADTFIATQAFWAFRSFSQLMNSKPYGWHQFDDVENNNKSFFALDTSYAGAYTRGLAVQQPMVVQIYNYLNANGDRYAEAAEGWQGNLTLEVPSSTVSCGPYRNTDERGSVVVEPISSSDNTSTTFTITIPPLATSHFHDDADQTWPEFSGTTCNMTFSRVRYPFGMWIISNAGTASVSVDHYGQIYNMAPIVSAYSPIDNTIAKALAIQTQATIDRFETLTYNTTATELFVTSARNLRVARPEYASDIEALSPVLALLTNQLFAIGTWNTTIDPTYNVTSEKIRWQLYGSGPRLGWEWVSVTVLIVLLLAMLTSLVFSIVNLEYPGEFLKPAGLLIAANTSPPIQSLRDQHNLDDEKNLASLRFFVKAEPKPSDKVFLTDNPKAGDLDPRKKYTWPRD